MKRLLVMLALVARAAAAQSPSPSPDLSQENAELRERLRQAELALAQKRLDDARKKLDDAFAEQKIVLAGDGGYQTRAGADHVYALRENEFLRRYQLVTGKLPPLPEKGGSDKAMFAGGVATLSAGLAVLVAGVAMIIAQPNPPHIPVRDTGIALTAIGGAGFTAGFSVLAVRRWRKPKAMEPNQARALVDEYNRVLLDQLKR